MVLRLIASIKWAYSNCFCWHGTHFRFELQPRKVRTSVLSNDGVTFVVTLP